MNCSGKCNCQCSDKTPSGGEFIVIFRRGENSFEVKDNFSKDETLLDIAMKNSIPMDHACGGNGACTTCMIKVKKGTENLTLLTESEMQMGMNNDNPEYRLGCQCYPTGDVDAEIVYL